MKLAYNGTAYKGWQVQPNGMTVQQMLEKGLKAVLGTEILVAGCGRTDSGVHASDFYAHFDFGVELNSEALRNINMRLNRFLPHDIIVYMMSPVIPEAHARFSALSREYQYLIIRSKDPFRYQQAYFVYGELDVEAMNCCANLLLGWHDFQCFSKTRTQVSNYFCNITHARWTLDGHLLTFTIAADRFLRNMVRAIVGTLLDVGKGKIDVVGFKEVLESRDRGEAGYSVPAKGLTLTKVEYDPQIFSEKPVWFSTEQTSSGSE